MTIHFSSRPSVLIATLAVASAAVTSACSPISASNTASSGGSTADLAERCATIAQQPTDPSAPLVTVVVDRTGSARELALSPNIPATMEKLQATGAVMQTIGVNGTGIDPTLSSLYPLDPMPGDSSTNADTIRQATLDCLPLWINTDATATQGGNTDLLLALAAAARQQPDEIIVISDGINTTGELDLSLAPSDPAGDADRIRSTAAWTAATPPVHWFHMAETAPPLSEPHRAAVTTFWKALLGDALTVDTRTGTTSGGS